MPKKYIDKIIDSYTKSPVDDVAKEEFHEWLTNDEFASDKEDALLQVWNQTESLSMQDTLSSFLSFQSRLAPQEAKTTKKIQIWHYAAAAVAVLVIIAGTYFFTQTPTVDPGFNEYYSQIGQSDTILLPDGSIVYTNSNTTIIYPQSFGKDNRTIYLSGEASFSVAKNKDIPFIVKANGFSITALGTEFDVLSYPNDSYFKTTLISGSIRIARGNDTTDYVLSVNDQFVYEKHTGNSLIKQVDVDEATAWQRGEFVFKNASINDVLTVLERNYAVSFQYKSGSFNDDTYSFRFKKDTPLADIMDIIKKVSNDFTYMTVGDSYYISSSPKGRS